MSKDTTFYKLKIKSRVEETKDAVTLYFDVPADLQETFKYKAGQYLNLRFHINGAEYRRAYSLSTSPKEKAWGVTIKMVEEGITSAHILHDCKEGDTIDVMPPEGLFTLTPDPERRSVYYFFAAGSGITPLMSQMKLLLEDEPMATIHLCYGNRDQESIIFKEWLDDAARRYSGQLTVDYILSQPLDGGFLGGLFGKKKGLWLGDKGRIDAAHVNKFLDRYPLHNRTSAYHICGPGEMITAVYDALVATGVNESHIHTEYFTPSSTEDTKGVASDKKAHTLVAHLRGERIETRITDNTILETLEEAGYDPPYSCTSGTCATCMAKVISGNVTMDQCFALSDQEVEDGFVLTCQAHPVDGDVEVTYDY